MVKIRVPTYREEPRYADAFSYKAWAWAHDRTERDQGVLGDDVEKGGSKLKWAAGARTTGLPPGEQERDTRTARYFVTLRFGIADKLTRFEVKDANAFARFMPGSRHTIDFDYGEWVVDGSPIKPLSAH